MIKVDHHYDRISKQLQSEQQAQTASEAQGFICGLVCGGQRLADDSVPSLVNLYDQVAAVLVRHFDQDSFEFQLLLPDDDVPLSQRLDALRLWCQGFLSGLGSSPQLTVILQQPANQELLNDIENISRTAIEANQDQQRNEKDYFTIVEYLRIAVLNLCA